MAILDYESNEVNPLAAWLHPNASAYLSSVQQRRLVPTPSRSPDRSPGQGKTLVLCRKWHADVHAGRRDGATTEEGSDWKAG